LKLSPGEAGAAGRDPRAEAMGFGGLYLMMHLKVAAEVSVNETRSTACRLDKCMAFLKSKN